MNLEQAKKQQMEELKQRQEEEQAKQEAEEKIGASVRPLLTDEARNRLNNVGLVNKGLYLKTVQLILYLQQAGQLQGKVSDQELKLLLDKMRKKREITIKRK